MRLGLIIKLALAGVVVLAIALVAVAKSIDVSAYRPLLTQAAKDATGRELEIKGRLSLRLSLNPALVAHDVTLSNVAWGSKPEMIKVQRLEANIGLVALLGRQVKIQRLSLIEPELLLERDAKGQSNWDFGDTKSAVAVDASASGTPTRFAVAQLAITRGHVIYKDAMSGRSDSIDVERFTLDAPIPGAPVGLLSGGTWNGRHFDVSGTLGSAGEFNDFLAKSDNRSFPVKLKAVVPGLVATVDGTVSGARGGPFLVLKLSADSADLAETGKLVGLVLPPLGAARLTMIIKGAVSNPQLNDIDAALGRRDAAAVTIKGSVKDPWHLHGIDLLLAAEGDSLSGFNKPLGLTLPAVGPLKATARLVDLSNGWRLYDVKAVAGRSDVVGELVLRLAASRPALEARLTSNAINLDELTGETPDAKAAFNRDSRLFPDTPLPWALLQFADGEVTWKVERLTDDYLLAQVVDLSARLKDGKLSAQTTVAALAGGKVRADLAVDAAAKPVAVQLALDADKVGLGEILRNLKLTENLRGGRSDLRLRLKGAGNSLHAVMTKVSGESLLVTGAGQFDGSYADALALDLFRQLAPWGKEKDTQMQCLVSRFIITDGLAKSDALLFDTTHMTVAGQGSVSLGTETLDLTLAPRPKEASLLSLALPLDVQGTLTQPIISPNKGSIVKGVAGAVGGLALVPQVGSGMGDANPCLAAIVQARRSQPARGKAKGGKPAALPLGDLMQDLLGK